MTPGKEYRNDLGYSIVIFDLRVPGGSEVLRRVRAVCREEGEIEMLDEEHVVLIVRPGTWRKLES